MTRPTLVLQTLVPKENVLAVLVDNSLSMSIKDGLEPRGKPLEALLDPASSFVNHLDEKFFLRTYLFDSRAAMTQLPPDLDRSGTQTNIPGSLERILADSGHLPLAGIVLLSDGANTSQQEFREVIDELRSRRVPVHTVGLGPEELDQDVELVQVSTPKSLLPESVASARVTLKQSGFHGSRGRLEVREGGALVQTKEIYFAPGISSVTTDVLLRPKSSGLKKYEFAFQPLEGEKITENNSRPAILRVEDERPRVLYVEGHPRWEFKFIRQAMVRDQHLRLETLLRTALNKFYRQGIEEQTTLATGFPSDREELFKYRGIIFGSIESSYFTYSQMEMVRDFVSRRGGGFLMLGGSSSFAAGKYQNTPIEDILPVLLHDPGNQRGILYGKGLRSITTTVHGEQHPALQLAEADGNNIEAWTELPSITDWNRTSGLKPGTTVLATLTGLNPGGARGQDPVLAYQRYGRGHALAFLTGSFWRQLLRWLVVLAKDPVSVETDRLVYPADEAVTVRAEVSDDSFNRINDATVSAVIISPNGESSEIPLHWTGQDGIYETDWAGGQDGQYEVTAEAVSPTQEARLLGRGSTSFLVSGGTKEFFDAVQKREFLQRLAEGTGGNYYTLDDIGNLPEEIVYTDRKASKIETLDLWDMPFNLLLIFGLLFAEWAIRKREGAI
jgi:uncharacterized membrane protein